MTSERPLCDIEGCCHPASFEYYVRWSEGRARPDIWAVCVHHRLIMRHALQWGLWSGGVRPATILEARDPEWAK